MFCCLAFPRDFLDYGLEPETIFKVKIKRKLSKFGEKKMYMRATDRTFVWDISYANFHYIFQLTF